MQANFRHHFRQILNSCKNFSKSCNFYLHSRRSFVYNQHIKGGGIRAKPRRTANFAIQIIDACLCGDVGCVGCPANNII